jgi:hypothetical protein
MTRDGGPFTNCARCFEPFYQGDRANVRVLAEEALDYLQTHS